MSQINPEVEVFEKDLMNIIKNVKFRKESLARKGYMNELQKKINYNIFFHKL